jgi:ribosomal protein S18 acetylase RimI-like enzyme
MKALRARIGETGLLQENGLAIPDGYSRDMKLYYKLVETLSKLKDRFTAHEIELALDSFQGPASLEAARINNIQLTRSQQVAVLFHHHISELPGYLAEPARDSEGWTPAEKEEALFITSVIVASDVAENGINLFKKIHDRGGRPIETPEETRAWIERSGVPSPLMGQMLGAYDAVSQQEEFKDIARDALVISDEELQYLGELGLLPLLDRYPQKVLPVGGKPFPGGVSFGHSSQTKFDIKPLTKEFALQNADSLVKLHNMIESSPGKHVDWTREQLTADMWKKGEYGESSDRVFRAKWEHSLVAVDENGRPIGLLIAYERTGKEIYGIDDVSLYIHAIVTDRDGYRNRGVGTRLMAELAQNLKKKGFLSSWNYHGPPNISLQTNTANEGAIRFYERLGFKRIGTKTYPDRTDYIYLATADNIITATDSPAAVLESIKNNDDLMIKALSNDGIEITNAAVAEILIKLGILVPVGENTGRYRFAEAMRNDHLDSAEAITYTGTLINAINDIRYKGGNTDTWHELVKMAIINQATDKFRPAIQEKRTLWHIIEQDVIPVEQRAGIVTRLNKYCRESADPEKIRILKDDETLTDVLAEIRKDPDAVVDIALSDESHILKDDSTTKMLVFKAAPGSNFIQLEGVLDALRALHNEDRDALIRDLLRIYSRMAGQAYKGDVPPPGALDDMREFAKIFQFILLPPAEPVPANEIPDLNARLCKLLTAA